MNWGAKLKKKKKIVTKEVFEGGEEKTIIKGKFLNCKEFSLPDLSQ